MIKTILMKNCATYPPSGVVIDDCQKVNFFYGPNGSGKSTIGNFLSNQGDPQYSDCKIKWDSSSMLDIEVYNREFRTHHFQEDINGVFTLGKATIEEIKALAKLKETRESKNQELEQRIGALSKKSQKSKHMNPISVIRCGTLFSSKMRQIFKKHSEV